MLTEQDFAGALRETLADATATRQPSTDLSAAVRSRLRSRRRRIVAARVAGIPLLAAVTVGAVTLWPQTHPHAATGKTSAGPTYAGGQPVPSVDTTRHAIELAGYTVSFPADYKLGAQDTNCTTDLHLSPGEQSRLVTTPDAACPLLIKAVLTALPPGVVKDVNRDGGGVNPDGSRVGDQDPALAQTYYSPTAGDAILYLPAEIPGGPTVYVALEFAGISPASVAQLGQLEHGLRVQPTP
jgi:hypothetical protein